MYRCIYHVDVDLYRVCCTFLFLVVRTLYLGSQGGSVCVCVYMLYVVSSLGNNLSRCFVFRFCVCASVCICSLLYEPWLSSLACPTPSSKEGSGQTHRAVLFKWVQEFLGPIIARKVWISLNSIIIYSKSRNEDSKNKQQLVNHSYCPCVSYLRPKLDNTRAT